MIKRIRNTLSDFSRLVKKQAFIAVFLAPLMFVVPAKAQDAESTTIGKTTVYLCYSDKLAGILPADVPDSIDKNDRKAVADWQARKRVAGNFKPSVNRFILKVSPFEWEGEMPEDTPEADLANPEKIQAYRQSVCGSQDTSYDKTYWSIMCSGRADSVLELPEEKSGGPVWKEKRLISSDRHIFINGFTTFWLSSDLKYYLTVLTGHYGNYVEEGHCETFNQRR